MKKIMYLGLAVSLLLTACNGKDEDEKYYKDPANGGGTMTLQGGEGGASAKNSVYVDLSTAKQTSIERVTWNIALYCGSEFGVKLNNTIGSRAKEANVGTTVGTVIDAAGFSAYKAALSLGMGAGSFGIVDAIGEDLSKFVIKSDRVYIYDMGDADTVLYKVKVSPKNNTTYTVSYSLWNSSEVKTLDITKDDKYSYVGVSFTANKQVSMQPAKSDWDIVWGRNTYISAMSPGVPFVMADIVFLNTLAGVQAKEILVSEGGSYADFTAEKAKAVQFSSNIDVIGSAWRNGGGPTSGPSVKTDRFYVIKDAQGNIYKLGFVSMNDDTDGGHRGYPEIKYALLVEAN